MSRLGWGILAGILIVVLAFLAMLGPAREGGAPPLPSPPRVIAEAGGPGPLGMPVAGVAAQDLVDSFGDARGGGLRAHGAIDIPAERGAMVLAASDGRVEKLFDSRLGGRTLYQRSTDGGAIYYYAHLDGYAPGVTEGMALARGQVIGFVGATGDADPSAPHLHFEVHRMAPGERWWQGTAVNPYPLLAAGTVGR